MTHGWFILNPKYHTNHEPFPLTQARLCGTDSVIWDLEIAGPFLHCAAITITAENMRSSLLIGHVPMQMRLADSAYTFFFRCRKPSIVFHSNQGLLPAQQVH